MIKEIMSCESLQEWETQLIQEIDRICNVIGRFRSFFRKAGVLEGSGVFQESRSFSGKQEFFRKAGVLEGSGVFQESRSSIILTKSYRVLIKATRSLTGVYKVLSRLQEVI